MSLRHVPNFVRNSYIYIYSWRNPMTSCSLTGKTSSNLETNKKWLIPDPQKSRYGLRMLKEGISPNHPILGIGLEASILFLGGDWILRAWISPKMSALFADFFSIESNLQIPWDPYHTTCCELLIEEGAGYIEVALQLTMWKKEHHVKRNSS